MSDVTIRPAVTGDIADLVRLESGLFAEDSGVFERFGDVTWPERHGAADLEALLASPTSVVLTATSGDRTVGLLVGYTTPSSPTRLPVTYGVLRTMYVAAPDRGSGIGGQLVEAFLAWARDRRCDELLVDHYAGNTGAGRFYERHGFVPLSVQRSRAV